MSIVIDLNLVCIVCLQNDGGELNSVFCYDGTVAESESNMTIADKISFCSELNLSDISIKISNKICRRCLDDLTTAWRFRRNCETANSLFSSIQQEENDVVSLANYEIECQKAKLPPGLKIRRVHPEMKSYLSSSQIDDGQTETRNDEDYEDKLENFTRFSVEEYIYEEDQDDDAESLDYFNCGREESLGNNKHRSLEKEIYAKKITYEEEEQIETNSQFKFDKNESSPAHIKEEVPDTDIDEIDISFIKPKFVLKKTNSESFQGRVQQNIRKVENGINTTQLNPQNNDKLINAKKMATKIRYPKRNTNSSETRKSSSKKCKSFRSPLKVCEICGNVYKYQHALSAHMRRHNNDRQFGCELCDKAFVSNVELRRHMRVHTGHKPYPCSFCDRRFSDFGSRSKHERTHTGERPYRCTTCNKSFAYPHVLTVHLRTHTGEKKFKCTRCGRGFTKKAYLLAHLENHARCENMTLIGGIGNNGSIVKNKIVVDTSQQVALEECILTTELIDDSEDNISTGEGIGHCAIDLEEVIDEEHLDEENHVELF